MTLLIKTESVALKVDADGVVRVGGTRGTFDTIVATFNGGATAEEIAQQDPSLCLADVYAVIGYYLLRRQEIEPYLYQRQERADDLHRQNESRFAPRGVHDGLSARAKQKATCDDSIGSI